MKKVAIFFCMCWMWIIAAEGFAGEKQVSIVTNATLNRLKVDFTNRVYIVGPNRIEVSFFWMSKQDASNYQGLSNLYLVSNEVAAFMSPMGRDTNAEGTPIWFGEDRDLMAQIETDLRSYLIKLKHPEEKIIFNGVNGDIFLDYLLKTSQNKSAGKDTAGNLFSSLEQTNDQLCITLPSSGIHWMIKLTLDKVYRSDYGQRLAFTNGQIITLIDRHISHEIRGVIEQHRAGLDVTTTEDMRSFGGNVTQKTYFIEIPKTNNDGPSACQTPLTPEAQRVLDDLNSWNKNAIDGQETHSHSLADTGEVTAYINDAKERLARLGVKVEWNHEKRIYEIIGTKTNQKDPISALVQKLNASNGLWKNGLFPSFSLPSDAKPEEVLEQLLKMAGLNEGQIKTYKIHEVRQVQLTNGGTETYSAALVESDLGTKILLFKYEAGSLGISGGRDFIR